MGTTIYRKTAKGQHEIDTRTHRLSPRVRQTLILVDGRRSAAELESMVQQAAESLQALRDGGFIEALPERAPVARPVRAPEPAFDLAAVQRDMVRHVNEVLGPAGEQVALRIERAKSPGELRSAMPVARQAIEAWRGHSAAEAFSAKFSARLLAPPAEAGG